MKPFLIRGSFQPDHSVVMNVSGLNFQQRKFVNSCLAQLNQQGKGYKATDQDSVAFVMYRRKDDFAAAILYKVQGTPDAAWQELEHEFNKATNKHPQVGFKYTRDEIVALGTEQAGRAYDLLEEGGYWPWPNARALFQKQGNHLVVVDTI